MRDLNQRARGALKDSGHIAKKDFVYTIKREVEDDFGRKHISQEKKAFSKGDRIVFTHNNNGLGVKNGTMGTITDLTQQKIQVTLEGGNELSFAPNLNPYFDQGWAVTIHKAQGTTVDKAFVLASYSMNQNLAYVAMTRHRDNVHLFGSSSEFSQPKHLFQALSKSGEKLSAADYLDAESLHELMKQDDHHLTKIFTRLSNELEAMGAVTKKAFWTVAEYFLGLNRDKKIRISEPPQGIREEDRAEEVLQKKTPDSQKVFETLTQSCQQYLYNHLRQENIPLTSEKEERIPKQAERAATYIFYAHTLKGEELTDKETRLYLLRAKVELDRLPQIKEALQNKWQKEGHFDKNSDPLIIQMIADRQASIEGRLYWEAKREGITPSPLIPDRAAQEFKDHRDQIKSLARTLSQDHSLSEKAATHCAKDILRYQEIHGDKPTQNQVKAMVEISQELEKSFDSPSAKNIGSHTLEYMRRINGDSMFRDKCYDERNSIKQERELMHVQENELLEAQKQRELLKQKNRGFGMEM